MRFNTMIERETERNTHIQKERQGQRVRAYIDKEAAPSLVDSWEALILVFNHAPSCVRDAFVIL